MTAIITSKNAEESLLSLVQNAEFINGLAKFSINNDYAFVSRTCQIALRILNNNPALLKCTKRSFSNALSLIIESNLELDRHCHLLVYKNECKFIINYQGYIVLAVRSGNVARIESNVVYKNDLFEREYGSNAYLKYIPLDEDENPEIVRVYALAEFTNGKIQFVELNHAQIKRIKDKSSGVYITDWNTGKKTLNLSSPWVTHIEWMWKKTALKQLFKTVPTMLSQELQKFSEDEEEIKVANLAIQNNIQSAQIDQNDQFKNEICGQNDSNLINKTEG